MEDEEEEEELELIDADDECAPSRRGDALELRPSFPWIPELLAPHIGMRLTNIGIHFQNIPSISLCTVTVAEWSMV